MAENHVVITNEKTLPLVFNGRLYAHTNTRKCVYIHMYIYKFQIECQTFTHFGVYEDNYTA